MYVTYLSVLRKSNIFVIHVVHRSDTAIIERVQDLEEEHDVKRVEGMHSSDAIIEKLLVIERVWRKLPLYLAEGTLEHVQERPRLGGRGCGLIRNRQRAARTMEPVLFLMPTLSDSVAK